MTENQFLTSNMTLLNTEQAARVLRVKPGTLNAWRVTNRTDLIWVKVGRKVFYRFSDIEKFLNRHSVQCQLEVV